MNELSTFEDMERARSKHTSPPTYESLYPKTSTPVVLKVFIYFSIQIIVFTIVGLAEGLIDSLDGYYFSPDMARGGDSLTRKWPHHLCRLIG